MRDGLRVIPVTPETAVRASMLETSGFHGDPIDTLNHHRAAPRRNSAHA
ncbi:MAG: hypothetical protein OXG47_05350 [bacterium]|nr:hypothetical protein [bacterium]